MEQKSSKRRTNPSKNRLAETFSVPFFAHKSILAAREKRKYDGSMRAKNLFIEIGKHELASLDHRYKDFLMKERRSLSTKENKKKG